MRAHYYESRWTVWVPRRERRREGIGYYSHTYTHVHIPLYIDVHCTSYSVHLYIYNICDI